MKCEELESSNSSHFSVIGAVSHAATGSYEVCSTSKVKRKALSLPGRTHNVPATHVAACPATVPQALPNAESSLDFCESAAALMG